jgi:hypothetical protein
LGCRYLFARALRAFIYVCGQEINEATGVVATDGTLTLSGQGVALAFDPMTLSSFKSTISGTAMTGTFSCTVNVAGSASNTYSITGKLQNVSLLT